MDVETAEWLVSEAGPWLAEAAALPDPASVAAGAALRRTLSPERAAAVLGQAALRRRAAAKLGPDADALFLTPDGFEQATRPEVAHWRARRLRDAGVRRIVDLGCGLGLDASAMIRAGIDVVGVDIDAVTATFARANTGMVVHVAAVEEWVAEGLGERDAVFADPARRTSHGRSWRLSDLSPSWEFVRSLLDGRRIACVKLGPGLAHRDVPDGVQATWVDHRGDVVEASLWAGPWAEGRAAVLLDGGVRQLSGEVGEPPALAGLPAPGAVLYEPSGAVIRAGALGVLARRLGARAVRPGIAYLIGEAVVATPFAEAFEIVEVLSASEKALRAWVRENGVGILEIKKRGVDVDPAAFRRRLRPAGPHAATLVLTPTSEGARALVVRRLPVVAGPGPWPGDDIATG